MPDIPRPATNHRRHALPDAAARVDITGLTADSREGGPGMLFAALPGTDPETAVRVLAAVQADLTNRITTTGLNLTALEFGYELTPLLRGDLLLLYDWSGRSAALAPTLSYQLRSDLELSLSGQFFLGRDENSQFGDLPALGILRIDAFF